MGQELVKLPNSDTSPCRHCLEEDEETVFETGGRVLLSSAMKSSVFVLELAVNVLLKLVLPMRSTVVS